jgi:transketolase
MVVSGKASHIASALSIADIVAVLYGSIMNIEPSDASFFNRDRFILSKGHACAAVYAALAELGFIEIKDLELFGKNYSLMMTHINHKNNGVEFSTGSLGHGLPFGVGKALSAKMDTRLWKTYVLLSDGELAEGSNWEAMLFAAHHQLENLIAVIDYNKLQSLGSVAETLGIEPLREKFQSFGWAVKEVDGHNHPQLIDALGGAPWEKGKPSILIAHTTKGKGVGFMENRVEWHYRTPTLEQLSIALDELKIAL